MPDLSLGPLGGILSKHFSVTPLAGDPDTLARAQAIAQTCENDLKTLEGWFSCNFDESPYGIIVGVLPGEHLAGASNYHYQNDTSSQIDINGTYAPPGGPANPALRDEMARMLFVAELAEILMEFSGSAWNPGNSMGEGLSLLAAETLHPIGYYATGQGPRINTWLNGSRPDSISSSVETDKDAVSYGCAVLFLNYLRYQLGFSFESIISAAVPLFGGLIEESLAGVFSTLTGRPGSLAYKEFTDMLQAHIPLGQPFTPTRDNLFPLGDSNQRTVSFSAFENELNAVKQDETLFIERQAGPFCPPNIYSYNNVNVFSQLDLTGRVRGFLQPTFTWAVNGIALNNSNKPQSLIVSMVATDTVPGIGEPPVRVDLAVKCLIKSSGLPSTLTIWNQSFPGNGGAYDLAERGRVVHRWRCSDELHR